MIFGFTEGPEGTSFDSMAAHQQQIASIVSKDPNVKHFMSSIGPSGPNVSVNTGRIFLTLKPRSERKLNIEEIIEGLRPKFASVPGIRVFLQNLPSIRIGGQLTKSLYQFTLQCPDIEQSIPG